MASVDDEFCAACGAILPLPATVPATVACALCHAQRSVKPVLNKLTYTSEKVYERTLVGTDKQSAGENPVIDKICDKCGHDQMSYACRQTRSVDEGQTVYYTCLKCKHSIVENA